jgi:hypothetical protein
VCGAGQKGLDGACMGGPEWVKLRQNALGFACFMPFRCQSEQYEWLEIILPDDLNMTILHYRTS